ncbi:fluoride efflux transporter CrcB [Halocatena halophila]|uniref:fluoride efflux transporter CrcB n=1 Tax=Halocatena halophila TaxID=2814576 RepID=UPI002ED4552B
MTTVDPAHIVGTGGALGAVLRYELSMRIDTEELPLGTLTVNVVGSFVLALLAFVSPSESLQLFFGTGACGSFTTFSSFSYEIVRFWEAGEKIRAIGYSIGTLSGAGGAIGLAWLLATFV